MRRATNATETPVGLADPRCHRSQASESVPEQAVADEDPTPVSMAEDEDDDSETDADSDDHDAENVIDTDHDAIRD